VQRAKSKEGFSGMMSVDQPAAAAIQEPAAQPDEAIFRVGQQVLAVNKTQLYVAKVTLKHPLPGRTSLPPSSPRAHSAD
jgi:hypothetical protein